MKKKLLSTTKIALNPAWQTVSALITFYKALAAIDFAPGKLTRPELLRNFDKWIEFCRQLELAYLEPISDQDMPVIYRSLALLMEYLRCDTAVHFGFTEALILVVRSRPIEEHMALLVQRSEHRSAFCRASVRGILAQKTSEIATAGGNADMFFRTWRLGLMGIPDSDAVKQIQSEVTPEHFESPDPALRLRAAAAIYFTLYYALIDNPDQVPELFDNMCHQIDLSMQFSDEPKVPFNWICLLAALYPIRRFWFDPESKFQALLSKLVMTYSHFPVTAALASDFLLTLSQVGATSGPDSATWQNIVTTMLNLAANPPSASQTPANYPDILIKALILGAEKAQSTSKTVTSPPLLLQTQLLRQLTCTLPLGPTELQKLQTYRPKVFFEEILIANVSISGHHALTLPPGTPCDLTLWTGLLNGDHYSLIQDLWSEVTDDCTGPNSSRWIWLPRVYNSVLQLLDDLSESGNPESLHRLIQRLAAIESPDGRSLNLDGLVHALSNLSSGPQSKESFYGVFTEAISTEEASVSPEQRIIREVISTLLVWDLFEFLTSQDRFIHMLTPEIGRWMASGRPQMGIGNLMRRIFPGLDSTQNSGELLVRIENAIPLFFGDHSVQHPESTLTLHSFFRHIFPIPDELTRITSVILKSMAAPGIHYFPANFLAYKGGKVLSNLPDTQLQQMKASSVSSVVFVTPHCLLSGTLEPVLPELLYEEAEMFDFDRLFSDDFQLTPEICHAYSQSDIGTTTHTCLGLAIALQIFGHPNYEYLSQFTDVLPDLINFLGAEPQTAISIIQARTEPLFHSLQRQFLLLVGQLYLTPLSDKVNSAYLRFFRQLLLVLPHYPRADQFASPLLFRNPIIDQGGKERWGSMLYESLKSLTVDVTLIAVTELLELFPDSDPGIFLNEVLHCMAKRTAPLSRSADMLLKQLLGTHHQHPICTAISEEVLLLTLPHKLNAVQVSETGKILPRQLGTVRLYTNPIIAFEKILGMPASKCLEQRPELTAEFCRLRMAHMQRRLNKTIESQEKVGVNLHSIVLTLFQHPHTSQAFLEHYSQGRTYDEFRLLDFLRWMAQELDPQQEACHRYFQLILSDFQHQSSLDRLQNMNLEELLVYNIATISTTQQILEKNAEIAGPIRPFLHLIGWAINLLRSQEPLDDSSPDLAEARLSNEAENFLEFWDDNILAQASLDQADIFLLSQFKDVLIMAPLNTNGLAIETEVQSQVASAGPEFYTPYSPAFEDSAWKAAHPYIEIRYPGQNPILGQVRWNPST